MSYSYRIYDTIDQCPLEDWNQLCEEAGANIFMNPGFLSVVEKAFASESRFWHLVIYDEQRVAAACTSVCAFDTDLLTLAGAYVKQAVELSRWLLPRLAKLKILFCGLPVSLGQHHLVIKTNADRDQVLLTLDTVLTDLAKREKARLIVYKEFDAATCVGMKTLATAGYQRFECPPSYTFRADFKDFRDYCAALKSNYGKNIRRSQRKFESAKLVPMHLGDAEEILRLYDDKLHPLYEAVVEKSDVKLEVLPIAFFRELVKQFPLQVSLTLILKRNRVIAFNWGLFDKRVFYFLFCGIDYSESVGNDLYFNLMYQQLDYALNCGPEYISIGQTADSFKSRLGCEGHPLYLYARGVAPAVSWLLKNFANFLCPKRPPIQQHSILKNAHRNSLSLIEP